jgi:hypothetical protein
VNSAAGAGAGAKFLVKVMPSLREVWIKQQINTCIMMVRGE